MLVGDSFERGGANRSERQGMPGQSTGRTGPLGRLARLVWAGIFGVTLLSIVGPDGSARFRNSHILGEASAWFLHLAMLAVFVILVGAVASALAGPQARGRWQLGSILAVIAGVASAGAIGDVLHGSAWGFPLADLVWWFDVLLLCQQVVATLLAIALGTPGCEIGVWQELIACARGNPAGVGAAVPCVIGLSLIDEWEARRASGASPAIGHRPG